MLRRYINASNLSFYTPGTSRVFYRAVPCQSLPTWAAIFCVFYVDCIFAFRTEIAKVCGILPVLADKHSFSVWQLDNYLLSCAVLNTWSFSTCHIKAVILCFCPIHLSLPFYLSTSFKFSLVLISFVFISIMSKIPIFRTFFRKIFKLLTEKHKNWTLRKQNPVSFY